MNHRARKRFGQNFLQDRSVIDRIVDAVGPPDGHPVVEIGPGLAALTLPLLAVHSRLDVIELDRDLVARLRRRELDGLHVHEGDALDTDYSALAVTLAGSATDASSHSDGAGRLRLVGNLPYNIGTPLLIKLARQHSAVSSLHVMLQREVVERMVASPGSKHWGRLSVILSSVFSVTQLFDVAPESFDPQPKVWSAVARLVPRPDIPDAATLDRLERVTRLAFANRRKTLRNNFKGVLEAETLHQAGVDPGLRAERLELSQFHALARLLPEAEDGN